MDGPAFFLLFLGHWLEDVWRVHTIDRYKTPDNTLYFIWDQIIHYVAIFAVAPFLELSNPAKTFFPEKWPIMGSLFVLVTSMTANFIDRARSHRNGNLSLDHGLTRRSLSDSG